MARTWIRFLLRISVVVAVASFIFVVVLIGYKVFELSNNRNVFRLMALVVQAAASETPFTTLFEYAASGFGITAVLLTATAFAVNRNQFHATLIISCTNRWQDISDSLAAEGMTRDARKLLARRYIDLCNEELQYLQLDYLPRDIVIEWIEAMVIFLPHLKASNTHVVDSKYRKQFGKLTRFVNANEDKRCVFNGLHNEELWEILALYPRIQQATRVNETYNLTDEREKRMLVRRFEKQAKQYRSISENK